MFQKKGAKFITNRSGNHSKCKCSQSYKLYLKLKEILEFLIYTPLNKIIIIYINNTKNFIIITYIIIFHIKLF